MCLRIMVGKTVSDLGIDLSWRNSTPQLDLCGADNVLDNNLLDCFNNIEDYFQHVTDEVHKTIFDDEINLVGTET